MDSSGHCDLQQFVKANEKIGVVMRGPKELEKIFDYFDCEGTGFINYKTFIKEIFNLKFKKRSNGREGSAVKNRGKKEGYDYPAGMPTPLNKETAYKNTGKKSGNCGDFRSESHGNSGHKRPFFDKLLRNLLEKGGPRALLSLYQSFLLCDDANTGLLNIDDFIRIIKENDVNLSVSDIQMLFRCYETDENSLFCYEEMFSDLN